MIDVKNGKLTLWVEEKQVQFNYDQSMKISNNEKVKCMRVDSLIPSIDELLHDLVIMELLERCLTRSLSITDLEG